MHLFSEQYGRESQHLKMSVKIYFFFSCVGNRSPMPWGQGYTEYTKGYTKNILNDPAINTTEANTDHLASKSFVLCCLWCHFQYYA